MKHLLLSLLIFSTNTALGARFLVEANKKLSPDEIKQFKQFKVRPFASIEHSYFSRLYSVAGNVTEKELQKMKWVRSIEKTVELTKFTLIPAENSEHLVADELFPYQWALFNQGQSYIKEKDDIHNLPLKGVTGVDIGFKEILPQLSSDQHPVIAVLDSGVDLDHPDLKDNLWKNEAECGKDPHIDHDSNKLAGDCHGWNFTESIDSDEAKNPQDNDGHGTHVAGIIAAAQNGIGIVGVNPLARIMPIKVMKDSHSKSEIAASESFAQGLIYATNMGADIINLSLGWPRSLETKHLREAVLYALSKNVIIVAAAGNNNSSEPLFPCAYEGVICTAASTLDGKFAGFSNFGGHIDTVTPGEGILSLAPTAYEPEFFSVPGYDIKSGTSQAAPILSGIISVLKSKVPTLSIDGILGRLYSATQNQDKKKYVLGGEASFQSLFREIQTPIVRPVLKRVRQIILRGKDKQAALKIPIRNYGLLAKDVKVRVMSLSPELLVSTDSMTIGSLDSSAVKELSFDLTVNDMNSEALARLSISISTSEGEFSFLSEIPIVREIALEASRLEVKYAQTKIPLGTVINNKIVPFVGTIETYGKSSKHEFYLRRNLKEEKKMEITVFSRVGEEVKEVPKKILLDRFSTLVNFIRLDLNRDGNDDYLVQYVAGDDDSKEFIFKFYNSDLNPLWTGFSDVKVLIDVNFSSLNDLTFIKYDHPELGKMLLPSFFSEGQLPKLDRSQDFYGRNDVGREFRLYYLEPLLGEKTFRVRSLTTPAWKEKMRKELSSKWYETILVENILSVSTQDAQEGIVRIIFSLGQGTKRKLFITSFDAQSSFVGASLPQLVLQTEGIDPLYSISPEGLDVTGSTFLNIYDRSRAKIVMTKKSEQVSQLNYAHESETDLIAGHIASFENGEEKFSVLQTRDELVGLHQKQGQVIKSRRPKLRYSFFSEKVLSEMYYPVVLNRNGLQSPALYVDSTAVTGNRVYLFEEQNGKLISSIKNSLIVPPSCKALNPYFKSDSGNHEFVFLCLEEGGWHFKTFGMH